MNWRKYVITGLLYLRGNGILRALKEIGRWEFKHSSEILELQQQQLTRLLRHSFNNVPYYRRVLSEAGIIKGAEVKLENFQRVPVLTKDIIRKERDNLHSSDLQNRKPYENTSGGSTGEPVRFVQDAQYDDWNIATKLYFNAVLGKALGEPEIKLWGSDRDIIEGNLSARDRVINFLYNRKFFNCYRFGEKEIRKLVEMNNRFGPVAYWSYMESALELARYLAEHDVQFRPPRFVISTIGPLTEEVRNKIETHMRCKVYNQYGSREVGAIACECKEQRGLHLFPWWNYVEIIDSQGNPVKEGEGRVLVTTLRNYSMPLIRYEIGDVAVLGAADCPCGRGTPLLRKVVGRTLGYFRKADSSLVHSHFLVQALFFRDWIKRFQIIQECIGRIVIRVQITEGMQPNREDMDDIIKKTKMLMGQECQVDFDFVDEIKRSPSGKFVYTVCNVK